MLVFVVIQFCGEFPRQFKSGDKAVDRGILRNTVLCVDDLEYQPALRLSQHLAKSLMAFINFLFLSLEFRWGIKIMYNKLRKLENT